ncbi:MAG: adenylate kinase [Halanaerobiaceae bacterium]
MNLVFLGLPGAGKGTHAKNLSEKYDMVHLASGNIFKNAVRENTPLGRKVRDYINRGELVPDDITIEIMQKRIKEHRDENLVFDGFPRTINQARALDDILTVLDQKLNICIYIEVEEENLLKRLSGRRICPRDGSIYHVEFNPPEKEGRCDHCGSPLHQRKDDRKEIVKKRIRDNRKRTEKLIKYYKNAGILKQIPGTERKPEKVQVDIDGEIEKILK